MKPRRRLALPRPPAQIMPPELRRPKPKHQSLPAYGVDLPAALGVNLVRSASPGAVFPRCRGAAELDLSRLRERTREAQRLFDDLEQARQRQRSVRLWRRMVAPEMEANFD